MFHFSAGWVRADPSLGSFAVGSVSAYISGRSHWLGRPLSRPHSPNDIASKGVCVPEGVTTETNQLWQTADHLERRKDGLYQMRSRRLPRVAIHIDAALPFGLSNEVARATADQFAKALVERFGVVVQWAVHNKGKISNDHVHFLISTRSFRESDFGRKVRQFDGIAQKKKELAEKTALFVPSARGVKQISSEMERMRMDWAELISNASGVWEDHRSFARQGLNYEPAPYISRGEIEFQKRQERRTGTFPAWKVAREIELRYRDLDPSQAGSGGYAGRIERSTRNLPTLARRARLRHVIDRPDANSNAPRRVTTDRLTGRSAIIKDRVALRSVSVHVAAPVTLQHQKPKRRINDAKARRFRLREEWDLEAKHLRTSAVLQAKLRSRDRLRLAMIEGRNALQPLGLRIAATPSFQTDLAKTARQRRVAMRALRTARPPDGERRTIATVDEEVKACSKALVKKASALARRVQLTASSTSIERKLLTNRVRERMATELADHIKNAVRQIHADGSIRRLLERQLANSALIELERQACMTALRIHRRRASRNVAIRARLRELDAKSRTLAQQNRSELDAIRQHQIELHSNFPNLEEIRLKVGAALRPREINPSADGRLQSTVRLADLTLEVTRRLHCDRILTREAITAIAHAGGVDEHFLENGLNKNRAYDPPPRALATLLSVSGQEVGSDAHRLIQAAQIVRTRKTVRTGPAQARGRPKGSEPEV